MRLTLKQINGLKTILHLLAMVPLIWLISAVNFNWLSADPAKDIQHFTGDMALRLLLGTLTVTPLARYLHQPALIQCRRLLGLWTFTWATLHMLSYAAFELGWDFSLLYHELTSRTYLLFGIISWIILLALAITSPKIAQRQLAAYWQKIHNFVYLVAILAPLHAFLSTKGISAEISIYTLIALFLLFLRHKKFSLWLKRSVGSGE